MVAIAFFGAGTLWPEAFYLLGWFAPVALLAGVQKLLGGGPGIRLDGRALAAMGGGVLGGAVFALARACGATPWQIHAPLAAYPMLGTAVLASVLFAFYGLAAQQIGDWLAEPWRRSTRPLRRINIPIRGEPKR
jgi:hypothetical protein